MEIKTLYDFGIKLTETILNYGALGITFVLIAYIWWREKHFDCVRRKKVNGRR